MSAISKIHLSTNFGDIIASPSEVILSLLKGGVGEVGTDIGINLMSQNAISRMKCMDSAHTTHQTKPSFRAKVPESRQTLTDCALAWDQKGETNKPLIDNINMIN